MHPTALVTGGSGFIGTRLCERLGAMGVEVHAVSRRAHPKTGHTHSWELDLRDEANAVRIVRAVAPDVIYHLAGCATARRGLEYVLPSVSGNLLTTVNILLAAATEGCARVLIGGSLEEPEETGAGVLCSSPYAASRWAATTYARMFHRLYGTPVVATRIAMVYGPGPQDPEKLIPYVIQSLLADTAPKLASRRREADWIYVDDVIDALIQCALAPGVEGEVIDIGSGTLTSNGEMVEQLRLLIASAARPEFGALPDRCFEMSRTADLDATEARIGWSPRVSLEDGLARTVDWFRASQTDLLLRPVTAPPAS
jgi:UDP-glucose 4-epimerase